MVRSNILRIAIHDLMNPRTVSFLGSATKYHTTQRAQRKRGVPLRVPPSSEGKPCIQARQSRRETDSLLESKLLIITSILKLTYSRVAGAGGGCLKSCWSLGKEIAIESWLWELRKWRIILEWPPFSDVGPDRNSGYSLYRNSALRGLRRARIHDFNEPTYR